MAADDSAVKPAAPDGQVSGGPKAGHVQVNGDITKNANEKTADSDKPAQRVSVVNMQSIRNSLKLEAGVGMDGNFEDDKVIKSISTYNAHLFCIAV